MAGLIVAMRSGSAAGRAGLLRVRRAVLAVGGQFLAERERWPLWLPVLLGAGAGFYFLLPQEPALWLGPSALAGAALGRLALRASPAATTLTVAVGALALGFAAGQLRTELVQAPVLAKRTGPVEIVGRIVLFEDREKGARLTLDALDIPGLEAERTPERVRVRVGRDLGDLRPGDRVTVRAVLLPPPGPVAPGAFDFQRQAYFAQLGATGYAMGPVRRAESVEGEPTVEPWLGRVRQAVFERITEHIDGAAGAMAAALLTGQRSAIPEADMEAMRDAGLAHLLAISGLNLGMVAGIVFFAVRAVLALFPAVALRFAIKKWAAIAALLATFAYMMLAGQTPPTERAFLMAALVLIGIMLDRTALSMRLVAWAAAVLLLFNPEYVLSVSFQMSFAATLGLIATYEALRGRWTGWLAGSAWWQRGGLYLGSVLLTSLVAGLATAPFVIYHFGRFALFGIAANMIAVPVTAFWIMPWGLLAFLLMPLGLHEFALIPMAWGVEAVLWTAHQVAGWPGAVSVLPAMPAFGLVLVALGGLWLALWRGSWRYWGLLAVLVGMASGAWTRPADVLVSSDGKLMAARGADGELTLSSARAGRFSAEGWLRLDGQETRTTWPAYGEAAGGRLVCDRQGCLYRTAGQTVAFVRQPSALLDDCVMATVVISAEPVRRRCPSARVIIDWFDLWRNGSYALWLDPTVITVENARSVRGARPWVPAQPE